LSSFTHAYQDVTNGRFEAASEGKVKNAKQIVLYALGFLCFSQKPSGKIFDLFSCCVFPCFLNVGVIKSMSDRYLHFLPPNWVKNLIGMGARTVLVPSEGWDWAKAM